MRRERNLSFRVTEREFHLIAMSTNLANASSVSEFIRAAVLRDAYKTSKPPLQQKTPDELLTRGWTVKKFVRSVSIKGG